MTAQPNRPMIKTPFAMMAEACEQLFRLVTNVDEGSWNGQTEEWQAAARHWREVYHQALNRSSEVEHLREGPVDLTTAFKSDEVQVMCAMFARFSVAQDASGLARSAAGQRAYQRFVVLRDRLKASREAREGVPA